MKSSELSASKLVEDLIVYFHLCQHTDDGLYTHYYGKIFEEAGNHFGLNHGDLDTWLSENVGITRKGQFSGEKFIEIERLVEKFRSDFWRANRKHRE